MKYIPYFWICLLAMGAAWNFRCAFVLENNDIWMWNLTIAIWSLLLICGWIYTKENKKCYNCEKSKELVNNKFKPIKRY